MIDIKQIPHHIASAGYAVMDAITRTFDLRDLHAYGGLSMIGYGLYEIFPAASFILCGLILLWLGVKK